MEIRRGGRNEGRKGNEEEEEGRGVKGEGKRQEFWKEGDRRGEKGNSGS